MVVVLKEEQREHASRLLELLSSRGVALDTSPTGSGKTYVAAWLAERFPDHRVAVVCPTIVKRAWKSLVGESRATRVFTYGMLTLAASRNGAVCCCSSEAPDVLALNPEVEAWLGRPRTLLILDEVHRARNASSQTSRALAAMSACVQVEEGGMVLALSATPMDGIGQMRLVPRMFARAFSEFADAEHPARPHGREEALRVLAAILPGGAGGGGGGGEREASLLARAQSDPYLSRFAERARGAEDLLRRACRPLCPFCILAFVESIRSSMSGGGGEGGFGKTKKIVEDLYLEGADALAESERLRAVHAYLEVAPPLQEPKRPGLGRRRRISLPLVPAPLTGPRATHLGPSAQPARLVGEILPPNFDFVQRTDWTLSSGEAARAWQEARDRFEAEGRPDLAWSASVPLLLMELGRKGGAPTALSALREVESRKALALARHIASRTAEGKVRAVAMFNFLAPMRACAAELRRLLGVSSVREICGETPGETRRGIVEEFSRPGGDGPACILCTMGTMSEGVGLHDERGDRPRELYILPNFSSIGLVQASGRIHRQNVASDARIFCVYAQRDLGGEVESRLRRRLATRKRTMTFLGTCASETAILPGGGGEQEEDARRMDEDTREWLSREYRERMAEAIRRRDDHILGKYRWAAVRMRPCFSKDGFSYMWNPLDDEDV